MDFNFSNMSLKEGAYRQNSDNSEEPREFTHPATEARRGDNEATTWW
jgi:hypothetical protein